MSEPKYRDFCVWYEENKDKTFYLNNELLLYCMNDVDMLLEALVAYRKLQREINNDEFMDDFYNCCTIASSVMRNIRTNHLQRDTVPITLHSGISNQRQSVLAIKFLDYFSQQHNIHFIHRDNSQKEHW
jgi:hypothetical protein